MKNRLKNRSFRKSKKNVMNIPKKVGGRSKKKKVQIGGEINLGTEIPKTDYSGVGVTSPYKISILEQNSKKVKNYDLVALKKKESENLSVGNTLLAIQDKKKYIGSSKYYRLPGQNNGLELKNTTIYRIGTLNSTCVVADIDNMDWSKEIHKSINYGQCGLLFKKNDITFYIPTPDYDQSDKPGTSCFRSNPSLNKKNKEELTLIKELIRKYKQTLSRQNNTIVNLNPLCSTGPELSIWDKPKEAAAEVKKKKTP